MGRAKDANRSNSVERCVAALVALGVDQQEAGSMASSVIVKGSQSALATVDGKGVLLVGVK